MAKKLFLGSLDTVEVAVWADDEDEARDKAYNAIRSDISSFDVDVEECTRIPIGWRRNDFPHGDCGDDQLHELTIGELVEMAWKKMEQEVSLAKQPSLFDQAQA